MRLMHNYLCPEFALRPCLEAKKFEYSNRVAYVLECTVRRPVVFYLWRQRAKCRVAHLHTLPPANIAYLVSSREQEAVIAADRNRQSGSNGGGDGMAMVMVTAAKRTTRATVAVATATRL